MSGAIDRPVTFADLPVKEEDVPPVSDRRWIGWTRPLLEFLARPRRWARMAAWAEERKINETQLRQLASWLEESDEAESVSHWGKTVWRQRVDREDDWLVRVRPEPEERGAEDEERECD